MTVNVPTASVEGVPKEKTGNPSVPSARALQETSSLSHPMEEVMCRVESRKSGDVKNDPQLVLLPEAEAVPVYSILLEPVGEETTDGSIHVSRGVSAGESAKEKMRPLPIATTTVRLTSRTSFPSSSMMPEMGNTMTTYPSDAEKKKPRDEHPTGAPVTNASPATVRSRAVPNDVFSPRLVFSSPNVIRIRPSCTTSRQISPHRPPSDHSAGVEEEEEERLVSIERTISHTGRNQEEKKTTRRGKRAALAAVRRHEGKRVSPLRKGGHDEGIQGTTVLLGAEKKKKDPDAVPAPPPLHPSDLNHTHPNVRESDEFTFLVLSSADDPRKERGGEIEAMSTASTFACVLLDEGEEDLKDLGRVAAREEKNAKKHTHGESSGKWSTKLLPVSSSSVYSFDVTSLAADKTRPPSRNTPMTKMPVQRAAGMKEEEGQTGREESLHPPSLCFEILPLDQKGKKKTQKRRSRRRVAPHTHHTAFLMPETTEGSEWRKGKGGKRRSKGNKEAGSLPAMTRTGGMEGGSSSRARAWSVGNLERPSRGRSGSMGAAYKSEGRLSRSPSQTHPLKPQIYCHALHYKRASSIQRGVRRRPLILLTEEQLMKELSLRCGKSSTTWSSPTQLPPRRVMPSDRRRTILSPGSPRSTIPTGRRSARRASAYGAPRLSTPRRIPQRTFAPMPTVRGENGGSPTLGGHGDETYRWKETGENGDGDGGAKTTRREMMLSTMGTKSGRRTLYHSEPRLEKNRTSGTNPDTSPLTTTRRLTKSGSISPSNASRLRPSIAPSTSFFSGSHFYGAE